MSAKLPELINTRAEKQWEILAEAVDFYDKFVVDIGCGYGDLMARAEAAGASSVEGYDVNLNVVDFANRRFQQAGLRCRAVRLDVDKDLDAFGGMWDIGICFSLIPYLKNHGDLLWWLRAHCETVFLEIQEKGDGPGLWTKYEIYKQLEMYFPEVTLLGHTIAVKDQEYERAIWMCEG